MCRESGTVVLGVILALVSAGALTSPAARNWLVRLRLKRRDLAAIAARSAQMGDYSSAVSRRLHGGDTLLQSLRTAAADGPMSQPLQLVVGEHEQGVTLARAVERWAIREATSEAALLSTAVTLASERVGARPELFDHVAAMVRARVEMASEADVHATQARASVWVVSALPWIVALALLAEGGSAARVLLTTPLGWFCIGTAAALELAGVTWMRTAVARALR